jgi:hypothetical protein
MKKVNFFFILFLISISGAMAIYSDRLNIPINYTANHTQSISLLIPSDIIVTIPSNMTLVSYSGSPNITLSNITWINETNIIYVLENEIGLQEGKTKESLIYINNIYDSKFTFVVVPDEKLTNCKAELGHGEGNWLESKYLPANQEVSLFNLVRIFTLASYYNEDALNASVTCVFPSYHILVSQGNLGTLIQHNSNNITATFYWDNLGRNWFRVAPLEQEITPQSIGTIYNISCGNMEYYYTTGKVTAPTECNSFEFRNPQPFNITYIDKLNQANEVIGKLITITNIENYTIYDTEIKFSVSSGDFQIYNLKQLKSGEMIQADLVLDGVSNLTTQINYISEWWANTVQNNLHRSEYQDIISYSINSNTPKIIEVVVSEFLQEGNNVEISNAIELYQGELHKGTILVFDFFGNPLSADDLPQIYILKYDGTIISNFLATSYMVSDYTWEYNTTLIDAGIYETIVYLEINGQPIIRNTYWRLNSGNSISTTPLPGNTGNTGPGNTPSSITSLTGETVTEIHTATLGKSCSLYGINNSFLSLCWWEWYMSILLILIVIKFTLYFKLNIKNVFKAIW